MPMHLLGARNISLGRRKLCRKLHRHGLNDDEKEQLMRENVTWYSYYSMPMKQKYQPTMPATKRSQDIVDNVENDARCQA